MHVGEPHAKSGVTISFPQRRVAVPTEAEAAELLAIVTARWPQLQRVDGAEFVVAFHRILHLGRREKLDTERGLAFWTDDTRAWQHQHQISPNIFVGGRAFTAAVIAHGDVPYAPLDRFPFDLGFGLVAYGGGRQSTDQWRHVLQSGALLAPMQSPYPVAMKSPARVQQLQLTGFRR